MKRMTGHDPYFDESHIYNEDQIEQWRTEAWKALAPVLFAEWLLAKPDNDVVGYATSVDHSPLAIYLQEKAKLPTTPWIGLAGHIKLQAGTLPPPPEGISPTPDIYLIGGSRAGSRSPYIMPHWARQFEQLMDRDAGHQPCWNDRCDIARANGQQTYELFPVSVMDALKLLVVAEPELFRVSGLSLAERMTSFPCQDASSIASAIEEIQEAVEHARGGMYG